MRTTLRADAAIAPRDAALRSRRIAFTARASSSPSWSVANAVYSSRFRSSRRMGSSSPRVQRLQGACYVKRCTLAEEGLEAAPVLQHVETRASLQRQSETGMKERHEERFADEVVLERSEEETTGVAARRGIRRECGYVGAALQSAEVGHLDNVGQRRITALHELAVAGKAQLHPASGHLSLRRRRNGRKQHERRHPSQIPATHCLPPAMRFRRNQRFPEPVISTRTKFPAVPTTTTR